MNIYRESPFFHLVKYALLILISLVVIIPLAFSVLTTFKSSEEYYRNPLGLPIVWYFGNYQDIFHKFDFMRLLANSLLLTLASVLIGSYVTVMAAYAFGKMQFRGRQLLSGILIPIMAVPAIVMVIPLFVFFSNLGLINSFVSPIIIYIGLIVPFSVYLLTSFMDSIPNEILEAASGLLAKFCNELIQECC